MADTATILTALSDTVEYVEQGLTGIQIRENLERDYTLTPSEARQMIVYARSLHYRLRSPQTE